MVNGVKILGFVIGSSLFEFYKEIVESDFDFLNLISVNFDEYVGFDGDNL